MFLRLYKYTVWHNTDSAELTSHFSPLQLDEVYLNLVLEFVPETIYRIIKHYSRTKRQVPTLYAKVGTLIPHPSLSSMQEG
jgi:hypothetical protein